MIQESSNNLPTTEIVLLYVSRNTMKKVYSSWIILRKLYFKYLMTYYMCLIVICSIKSEHMDTNPEGTSEIYSQSTLHISQWTYNDF